MDKDNKTVALAYAIWCQNNSRNPCEHSWNEFQQPKKDWEITAFRAIKNPFVSLGITYNKIYEVKQEGNGTYRWKNDNGDWDAYSYNEKDEEWRLINKSFEIYSVKRLSDGVEFKIDDRFNYNSVHSRLSSPIIEGFKIEAGNLVVCFEKDNYIHLSFVKPTKQPLFKTEDEKDIYNGDEYYNVQLTDFNLNGPSIARNFEYNFEEHRFFSTKEAAEEYILLNKPCLSIAELKSKCTLGISLEKTFKEIVKTKIKQ